MCENNESEYTPFMPIGELAKALAKAQGELVPAAKNATNPFLKNKYADLASCIAACREVLPKHGLAYAQCIIPSTEGTVCVETILMHESGQFIKSRCVLPCTVPISRDGKPAMNAAQAAGSAITYARRYGLSAIVGLVTEDDDGNAAAISPKEQRRQEQERVQEARREAETKNPDKMSDQQRKALMARLNELGCKAREDYLMELSRVLGRTVNTSKELTVSDFRKFMEATENKAQNSDDPFADLPDYQEASNA